MLSYG